MLISTLQRGSFRFDWRPRIGWLRHLVGGALMGIGTALLPGGNDALILYGIPSFSAHALPSYAALIGGIALGLFGARLMFGHELRAACRDDLYYEETVARR